ALLSASPLALSLYNFSINLVGSISALHSFPTRRSSDLSRRVHHLGMELDRVDAQVRRLHRPHQRTRAATHDAETRRCLHHLVTVGHPDLLFAGQTPEEDRVAGDLEPGLPVFPLTGAGHLAAEQFGHHLVPVTDAEH